MNFTNDLDKPMPKLATTHSLSNYPKLSITQYREQLIKCSTHATVTLSYSYRGKDYRYPIQVNSTPCNYGGYRYWWSCPSCSKRVAVLYCAGSYVCRHCIGASYQTQLIQPIDRLFKRVAVLRARLGWHGGLAHGIGDKPKGMHQRTFDKLLNEYVNIAQKIIGKHLAMLGDYRNEVSADES